jgi:hypothetical protein
MTKMRQVFADIESLRETWTMSAATPAHTAVMQGTRAGVTLSGTPGATQSVTVGGITISGIQLPDNGQAALHSSVHTTGTFDGPVTGASSATAQGTKVYFVVADKSLTLTHVDDATTPYFGVVNYPEGYVVNGTVVPVKIGVSA